MTAFILVLVLCGLLLLILPPLFERGDDPEAAQRTRQAEAEARQDATWRALADLEDDFAADRLSRADYERLRPTLLLEAAGALRDLEQGERSRPAGTEPRTS